eukprot:symbB.v1.2.035947.t1/scaffold4961.1/size32414/2
MAAPKLMRSDTKGSRLSLSSAASNIDVSEIGELKRFLQRQFDKQEELLGIEPTLDGSFRNSRREKPS